MPIIKLESCIFEEFEEGTFNLLAHQANIYCKMGSGIAKIIAEKYPQAVYEDNKTKSGDYSKLGKYTIGYIKDDKCIINLYAQDFSMKSGKNTKYDALYDSLYSLKDMYKNANIPISIGVPYRIGCGLAKGNWKIVNAILEDLFNDSEIKLYICRNLSIDPYTTDDPSF